MKVRLLVLLTFIYSSLSFSQSISVNAGTFKCDNYNDAGIEIGFEYNNTLSENWDYFANASLLYNNSKSSGWNLDYFLVPVNAGIRYYFLKSTIMPFISLEAGLNYFNNDQAGMTGFRNGDEWIVTKFVNSYDKIAVGTALSAGSFINISEKLKINLHVKYYIGSDRYSDYGSLNGGILFDI